eukprot:GHVT01064584.1.p1 GENE.GHVT01064584.1~~GHVT01064584.1.p1  ORF type:complete len:210 (+),score=34.72 GHVT01064584.1:631-1260(+)
MPSSDSVAGGPDAPSSSSHAFSSDDNAFSSSSPRGLNFQPEGPPSDPLPPSIAATVESSSAILDFLSPDSFNPRHFDRDLEKEAKLDEVDSGLSVAKKDARMIGCFEILHGHYVKYREHYVAALSDASQSRGMREDEAFRVMLHGSWVACYHNVNDIHLGRFHRGILSDQETAEILKRTPETPYSFSRKQTEVVERVTSVLQVSIGQKP